VEEKPQLHFSRATAFGTFSIHDTMSTPSKTGAVFNPAPRIVANPFATGIVVAEAGLESTTSGIRWNEPQSLGLDELDENAASTQIHSAAVTPGKSILKTPGNKTPGARLRFNNNNSGGGLYKLRMQLNHSSKAPGFNP
jgi:hypothetical protein